MISFVESPVQSEELQNNHYHGVVFPLDVPLPLLVADINNNEIIQDRKRQANTYENELKSRKLMRLEVTDNDVLESQKYTIGLVIAEHLPSIQNSLVFPQIGGNQIQEIIGLLNQMNGRFNQIDGRLNQIELLIDNNHRKLSNMVGGDNHPLIPLRNINGLLPNDPGLENPVEFPQSLFALTASNDHGYINSLMLFYGLPNEENITLRKAALRRHFGLRN
mmetsp:Transcript_22867/g.20769  ORF Transcript_22867/g.20769 Transcript_22867/m.20769 type:complete len:220 (+) Transcript_22867:25-684(+)